MLKFTKEELTVVSLLILLLLFLIFCVFDSHRIIDASYMIVVVWYIIKFIFVKVRS